MAGAPLVKEGDEGDAFFVILEGIAKVMVGKRDINQSDARGLLRRDLAARRGQAHRLRHLQTPMRVLVIDRKKFLRLAGRARARSRSRCSRAGADDPPHRPIAGRVMRVEFHQPDEPDTVVATAAGDDGAVRVESEDETVRAALERAFRPTPVVVDDGAHRQQGTRGEVLVAPGTLEWFRAVAQARATGGDGAGVALRPRRDEGGYDPAAQYRTFEESVERLTDGAA